MKIKAVVLIGVDAVKSVNVSSNEYCLRIHLGQYLKLNSHLFCEIFQGSIKQLISKSLAIWEAIIPSCCKESSTQCQTSQPHTILHFTILYTIKIVVHEHICVQYVQTLSWIEIWQNFNRYSLAKLAFEEIFRHHDVIYPILNNGITSPLDSLCFKWNDKGLVLRV